MKDYVVQFRVHNTKLLDAFKKLIDEIDEMSIKVTNQQIDKQLADAWRELFAGGQYAFDPLYASEIDGDLACFFCRAWFIDRDDSHHSENCTYMKVKAILAMEKEASDMD